MTERPLNSVTVPVMSNTELFKGGRLMWIEAPEIARSAQPGQFVMVKCGPFLLRRPLAVHQVDTENGYFALLFNFAGRGTGWLAGCKNGESVNILGPLGNGFELAPGSRNILMVTGGMGIAPIWYAAQAACQAGKSVVLLQGATTADCTYPVGSLPNGISCRITTEDGSLGSKCKVTGILPEYIGWADQIMACGPHGMYHPIAQQNNRLFRRKPFSVSIEVNMGCGFGVCYGCSIMTRNGMKKVCSEGPVFDYYTIDWSQIE